jgi:hypothetical protein
VAVKTPPFGLPAPAQGARDNFQAGISPDHHAIPSQPNRDAIAFFISVPAKIQWSGAAQTSQRHQSPGRAVRADQFVVRARGSVFIASKSRVPPGGPKTPTRPKAVWCAG